AGHALHFVDWKVLLGLHILRVEFITAVVVTGDHEDVAVNPATACRSEPVGTAAFDELYELKLVWREVAPEGFHFVGGIHGDAANRLASGLRIMNRDRNDECGQEDEACAR